MDESWRYKVSSNVMPDIFHLTSQFHLLLFSVFCILRLHLFGLCVCSDWFWQRRCCRQWQEGEWGWGFSSPGLLTVRSSQAGGVPSVQADIPHGPFPLADIWLPWSLRGSGATPAGFSLVQVLAHLSFLVPKPRDTVFAIIPFANRDLLKIPWCKCENSFLLGPSLIQMSNISVLISSKESSCT